MLKSVGGAFERYNSIENSQAWLAMQGRAGGIQEDCQRILRPSWPPSSFDRSVKDILTSLRGGATRMSSAFPRRSGRESSSASPKERTVDGLSQLPDYVNHELADQSPGWSQAVTMTSRRVKEKTEKG